MEDDALDLVTRSIRSAISHDDDSESVSALAQFGWAESYQHDPRAATVALFVEAGRLRRGLFPLEFLLAAELGLDVKTFAIGLPATGIADGFLFAAPAGRVMVAPPAVSGTRESRGPERWTNISPVGGGLDASRGMILVQPLTHSALVNSSATTEGDWTRAVAAASRGLGYQLLGTAREMLRMSTAYVSERRQFGRPIGGFQAVKHQLANALVAVEGAATALELSWSDRTPQASAAAKALAGRAAILVSQVAQQVHGAIGFTWDYPLHLFVREAQLLDALFESANSFECRIGADLLAGRGVPRIGTILSGREGTA